CPASNQRLPCAAGCSRAQDPSGASPARSSARQTPGATDNTSPRSPRSGGLRPPCSCPAKPEHRLAAASQRSLQACIASLPLQSPGYQRHTSSRTTSMGVDQTIKYAPGGVGHPIKFAFLKKEGGDWVALRVEGNELQEPEQHVDEIERLIGGYPTAIIETAPATPLPDPPADTN